MSLIKNFNESYARSGGHDLLLGLAQHFAYGSNSFCPTQMQSLLPSNANDAATESPAAKILGLK
jgi:hypothetical protein